ncbi:MAG: hypothetical protein IJJ78_03620 [Paludibacteraceae bacterium]|nr:hypothetical protein [Paludibacteraceae bacterium]
MKTTARTIISLILILISTNSHSTSLAWNELIEKDKYENVGLRETMLALNRLKAPKNGFDIEFWNKVDELIDEAPNYYFYNTIFEDEIRPYTEKSKKKNTKSVKTSVDFAGHLEIQDDEIFHCYKDKATDSTTNVVLRKGQHIGEICAIESNSAISTIIAYDWVTKDGERQRRLRYLGYKAGIVDINDCYIYNEDGEIADSIANDLDIKLFLEIRNAILKKYGLDISSSRFNRGVINKSRISDNEEYAQRNSGLTRDYHSKSGEKKFSFSIIVTYKEMLCYLKNDEAYSVPMDLENLKEFFNEAITNSLFSGFIKEYKRNNRSDYEGWTEHKTEQDYANTHKKLYEEIDNIQKDDNLLEIIKNAIAESELESKLGVEITISTTIKKGDDISVDAEVQHTLIDIIKHDHSNTIALREHLSTEGDILKSIPPAGYCKSNLSLPWQYVTCDLDNPTDIGTPCTLLPDTTNNERQYMMCEYTNLYKGTGSFIMAKYYDRPEFQFSDFTREGWIGCSGDRMKRLRRVVFFWYGLPIGPVITYDEHGDVSMMTSQNWIETTTDKIKHCLHKTKEWQYDNNIIKSIEKTEQGYRVIHKDVEKDIFYVVNIIANGDSVSNWTHETKAMSYEELKLCNYHDFTGKPISKEDDQGFLTKSTPYKGCYINFYK